MRYAVFDNDTKLLKRFGDCAASDLGLQALSEESVFEVPSEVETVQPGLTLVDGEPVWTPPAPPEPTLEDAKAAKLATLASYRYDASAVFTYGGMTGVASDDQAQSRLTATLAFMSLPGAPASVGWEMTPGTFVELTLSDLQAFGGAMGAHVQACWAKAQALSAVIASTTTLNDLKALNLSAEWPGTTELGG